MIGDSTYLEELEEWLEEAKKRLRIYESRLDKNPTIQKMWVWEDDKVKEV